MINLLQSSYIHLNFNKAPLLEYQYSKLMYECGEGPVASHAMMDITSYSVIQVNYSYYMTAMLIMQHNCAV